MKITSRAIAILSLTLAAMAVTPLASSQAAAPKAGGACTTPYSATTIGGKNYSCMKNAGGKLVWMAAGAMSSGSNGSASSTPSTKPSISGGGQGGPGGDVNGSTGQNGGRGFGGTPDPARQAAMKKYSDCLVAHGGTAFTFGGRRGFGGPNGARPTGAPTGAPTAPRTMPTISAKEQKAMTACKALAPAFGGGRGFGGPGGARPSGMPTPAATTAKQ